MKIYGEMMKKLIMILLAGTVLTACGCETKIGKCAELVDGTGQFGVIEAFNGNFIIRLSKTGNLLKANSRDFILVANSKCGIYEDE